MNTKSLMTLSAMILALIGISLIFLPKEILDYLELSVSDTLELLMQIIGSLYFAFAMLNWMSKGSLIGGIYGRPIAIANLTHFVIAGLALIKGILSNPSLSYIIWSIAIIYSIFAILFGIVAFKHPVSENKIDNQTSSDEEELSKFKLRAGTILYFPLFFNFIIIMYNNYT